MDAPARQTALVVLALAAFVAGNVFFQGLFLAFPLTCRQWAILFVASAVALVLILAATVVLLVPRGRGG